MIRTTFVLVAVLALVHAECAWAALDTTRIDANPLTGATVNGTIAASEYNNNTYSYTGGGTGFGGALGNGTLYFESDTSNLYIGANIAADIGNNNIIAIFLDTKSGGFSNDSTLTDTSDGGRGVASKLTRDVQDNFPINADYVLEFGKTFSVVFELNTGTLNTVTHSSAGSGGNGSAGGREASIALSFLGINPGQNVDFFAVLISESRFSSNEGIPNPGIANNPGFDNSANGGGAVTWSNFNRFTTAAIPEPSAALAIPVALVITGLGASCIRRWKARSSGIR